MATVGNILLTGGAGFVGSHTLVELVKAGYSCIVVDNLSNASLDSIDRCETILNKPIKFVVLDLLDIDILRDIFRNNMIEAVIHFAGLKSVGESIQYPLSYYHNNICSTINLLSVMNEFSVKRIVFSSSATVYGVPQYLPIDEKHPTGNCSNPYGTTKYMIETIIKDQMESVGGSYIHLRYFNPVGAHESGLIGEMPKGTPNNLFPYIADVAAGKSSHVNVFGNDYDTPDGTGVRDYIHVVDLAKGHTKAIDLILSPIVTQKVYNLGTGKGYSVFEAIRAYEQACGKKLVHKVTPRRSGDVACVYADNTLARRELDWSPQYDLSQMCEHSWKWRQMLP